MIYTVGLRDNYERYLDNNPDLEKAAGGTVWKSFREVSEYLYGTPFGYLYNIYGVMADWETDTKESKVEGARFRDLTRDAKIVRINRDACFFNELIDEYMMSFDMEDRSGPQIPMKFVTNKPL